MKRFFAYISALAAATEFSFCTLKASAEEPDSAMQYSRSSLYSYMVSPPGLKMVDEIV